MDVDIYYFYHWFGLKAFEGRHIIIVYRNQLFSEVTVVKELRKQYIHIASTNYFLNNGFHHARGFYFLLDTWFVF
jgi:hypothetical protein